MAVTRIGRVLERHGLQRDSLAVNDRRLRRIGAGIWTAVGQNRGRKEIVERSVLLHHHDYVADRTSRYGLPEQRRIRSRCTRDTAQAEQGGHGDRSLHHWINPPLRTSCGSRSARTSWPASARRSNRSAASPTARRPLCKPTNSAATLVAACKACCGVMPSNDHINSTSCA